MDTERELYVALGKAKRYNETRFTVLFALVAFLTVVTLTINGKVTNGYRKG
jgi:hypothetical protein